MIFKLPNNHLTDQEFFTYMRFFDFVIEKKEINSENDESFNLKDISIGSEELGYVFNRIFMSTQLLNTVVNIEKGYDFDKQLNIAKEKIESEPLKDRSELTTILTRIKKNKKIKIEEIATISWVWYEIYDHISITPADYKIPKEIETIFRTEINKYLDSFINNKLSITKKNYYKFEKQKQILINIIDEDKKIDLYGNNFIITEKIDNTCILARIPDFCIIHTVYALQKIGYLKVIDIWEELRYPNDPYSSLPKSTRYINANIILEDIFIKEINNKYKKDNPKNVFEKFDEKLGILSFAGEKIELSKKGKETDAVLLMKTLLRTENDDWKHNDEILEDWGYNDEDQKTIPKNKVYFAGQKINNAIALKTQIDDFIECNTSKARINPKYRKIDE